MNRADSSLLTEPTNERLRREQAREYTLGRPPLRKRGQVCVVDGYGLRIGVERGRLLVCDGAGRQRRERCYARAGGGLARLVVLGCAGSISLAALRWLSDLGVGFLHLDRDGRLLAASAGSGLDEPRLRRAQALAASNETGIEVARFLLEEKLTGQAALLARLEAGEGAQAEVDAARLELRRASSLEGLRRAEAVAARAYWAAWADVPVAFARVDQSRVPAHWLTVGSRGSPLSSGPRSAITPANGLLNYLYSLLAAEARLACLALGLDPGLGVIHVDERSRDSLALDLLEPVRPQVDRYLLDLLEQRAFRAADFHETRRGVCRILAPLTHLLAETAPAWGRALGPVAEQVAQILAASSPLPVAAGTPLTESKRRAAAAKRGRQTRRSAPERLEPVPARPRLPLPACRECGAPLTNPQRRICPACWPAVRAASAERLALAGPAARARLRADGEDPSQSAQARARRGQAIARRNAEAAAWEGAHPDAGSDPDQFRSEILPAIAALPLSKVMAATGLSKAYCSQIRSGRYLPHPRHWPALRAAIDRRR